MFGTVCPRSLLTLPVETSFWVLEAGVSKRGVVLWAPVAFFLGRPCVPVGRGAVCTSGCSVLCLSCRGCSGSTQSTCASSGADSLWRFVSGLLSDSWRSAGNRMSGVTFFRVMLLVWPVFLQWKHSTVVCLVGSLRSCCDSGTPVLGKESAPCPREDSAGLF